jgi:hypothetical protein
MFGNVPWGGVTLFRYSSVTQNAGNARAALHRSPRRVKLRNKRAPTPNKQAGTAERITTSGSRSSIAFSK